MTMIMTHHWFYMKWTLFLFLLATWLFFGEVLAPAAEVETQPAQEQQPGAEPLATPSAPVQLAPNQQLQTAQQSSKNSPANDAARYLAGLPVQAGSQIAALTQEPIWQEHA